mgnify:CR=1 FL=1
MKVLKLAQENEGSTVKLMSLTSASTLTVTGGKFTVDFNGKKVRHSFDVNGGDVTFTSSAEKADAENLQSTIKVNGADAKVTIDGKIKLKRVRTLSGTLTVNSTDGYIDELSTEGGKTVIDGARIGALRTFGGEAVINDVNADSLTMCDNRSGGSKYNISIVSGRFGSFTCNADSGYTIGKVMSIGRFSPRSNASIILLCAASLPVMIEPVSRTLSPALRFLISSSVIGSVIFFSTAFPPQIVALACLAAWQQMLTATGIPAMCVGEVSIFTPIAVVLPPSPAGPNPILLISVRSSSSSCA